MRVSRSFTPFHLALAVSLLGASRLDAQSCTSQPLGWGERSLAMSVNDASVPGGVLGTRGKKDGAENLLEIWYQSPEIVGADGLMGARWAYATSMESDAKTAARAAKPKNAKGPLLCGMLDWLAVGTGDYSQSTILIGFGYAFGHDYMSVHAIPEIGWGDKGVGMVLQAVGGATVRSGKWFAGMDLTMPLNQEGSTVGMRFRGGFTFGQAVPPKGSAPTTTGQTPQTTQPQTQGTIGAIAAATVASAPATQAGTAAPTTTTSTTSAAKPYSIDDITGMLANSLTTTRILDLSKRSCINFKMTEAYETRLRRAGAEPELLDGLKKTCYAGL